MAEGDILKLAAGGAGGAAPEGWSEEDKAWLAKLPELHQITAKRYGRLLWSVSMNAGVAGHSLGQVLKFNRGNRAVQHAVAVLQQVLNELVKTSLQGSGYLPKDLRECQTDIERAASLATVGGQRAAADGKIILGH